MGLIAPLETLSAYTAGGVFSCLRSVNSVLGGGSPRPPKPPIFWGFFLEKARLIE